MLFNSYIFILLFLPISLVGYYTLARIGPRPAGAWIVISSFAFYAWWNPPFLVLLLSSIAFNYLISLGISRNEGHGGRQNLILGFGIAVNLGVLVYYKYLFSLVAFFDSLGLVHLSMDSIILPLGISFYTFTQIGFLVDCRQGMAKEKGLLEYVLFVSFFPHLIAGPILHHREMMPQFAEPETYRFNISNMVVGTAIFIMGLAKKVLVADSLIPVVSGGFASPETLGVTVSWTTALAYSLQLYFDFSAYSDMAIGLAFMFNVRFPLNFNSPYKARSIIDFWQRWHMTLTRYLTLYLYNPMAIAIARRRVARGLSMSLDSSKTAGGFLTMIAGPVLITMVLAGVWHGAGLQFLIFGLLHALYLIINHAWRTFGPSQDDTPSSAIKQHATAAFQVMLTYAAVVVAQVFFRAESVDNAFALLAGMAGLRGFAGGLAGGWAYEFGSAPLTLLRLSCYFAIVWIMPNVQEIMTKYPAALAQAKPGQLIGLQWEPTRRWAIASGLIAGFAILDLSSHTEFLYFQF
jgi:alginate O-acetyltransferase complex protein AlgI